MAAFDFTACDHDAGMDELHRLFGAAAFRAQAVEYRLYNILMLSHQFAGDKRPAGKKGVAALDDPYDEFERLSGKGLNHLIDVATNAGADASFTDAIESFREARNRLTHHFCWDHGSHGNFETAELKQKAADELVALTATMNDVFAVMTATRLFMAATHFLLDDHEECWRIVEEYQESRMWACKFCGAEDGGAVDNINGELVIVVQCPGECDGDLSVYPHWGGQLYYLVEK